MLKNPTPFTGGLYAWRKGASETVEHWCARTSGLEAGSTLLDGWRHVVMRSSAALAGEDESVSGPFVYDFLIRIGTSNRFLLLSNHVDLSFALIERASLAMRIYRPEINVHDLVMHLTGQPGKYSIGAVYARIEGQAQALRTSALYGSDLGESELFRRLLREMNCYRVTLRDVVKRCEVISVGAKGEVGFVYSNWDSLRDADTVLRFMSMRGYLNWETDISEITA